MRLAATLLASLLLAAPALAGGAAPSPSTGAPASRPAASAEPLDINSASQAELDALPGIGAVRSEAIIKGRPYRGKNDLVSRGIVPESVYETIKDRIVARQ